MILTTVLPWVAGALALALLLSGWRLLRVPVPACGHLSGPAPGRY